MHVSEYIPIDPAVADQVLLRRLASGTVLLIFAFDEGEGPRVTAKVLVTEATLEAFNASVSEVDRRQH